MQIALREAASASIYSVARSICVHAKFTLTIVLVAVGPRISGASAIGNLSQCVFSCKDTYFSITHISSLVGFFHLIV